MVYRYYNNGHQKVPLKAFEKNRGKKLEYEIKKKVNL